MKLNDLPNRFRIMYSNIFCWDGTCMLIKLGNVRKSGNPYFATEEKQVENQIVRWYGKLPTSKFATVMVEREDGTVWKIILDNFAEYEIIRELETA